MSIVPSGPIRVNETKGEKKMTTPAIDPIRTVTTQAEFDQAIADEIRVIEIESPAGVWILVRTTGSSTVRALGSSAVLAAGSATVYAYNSATVLAFGSAKVQAFGSATVHACDSATVHAYNSATVHACDSSAVYTYDSSAVYTYDSATVHGCVERGGPSRPGGGVSR